MRRCGVLRVAGAAALAVAVALVPTTATAHRTPSPPKVTVLTDQVSSPFNLAVRHGKVYVADGGATDDQGNPVAPAAVLKLTRSGVSTVVPGPAGGDVAGVDVTRHALAYTSSVFGPTGPTQGKLTILGRHGKKVEADLAGYEAKKNPDANVSYGIDNPSPCVQAAFDRLGFPASNKGLIDSHPYSVTSWKHGSWIVADAGGNDLLRVSSRGHISKLAVLPAQPLLITADIAKALGFTDAESCVVGQTYKFEAVPTDVEVGPHGWLYVSTLPGGPEDPSLGARGSVYKVNPWTGKSYRLATGFAGATNLAVGRDGTVYVTELFGAKISQIKRGKVSTFVGLPGALSVEVEGRTVYAGTFGAFTGGKGTVVKITR